MTTTKSYDNLNRLTSITNLPSAASAIGFRYAYNSANQRTSVTNADTARWIYQYDSLGQVVSGKKYWSDGTPVAGQQFEYVFDDIGNRKTTGSGGDQFGVNLRGAGYTNNSLNQITGRSVPSYVDVLGSATNTATVTVNNQPTYRRNDYFRAELTVANTSPLWFGVTNLAVLNNGTNADIMSSVTGNVLVAKSPEAFTYDADGNLTSDSLWTNVWDAENRLTRIENVAAVSSVARRRVDWAYLPDGRWAERVVSAWNGSMFVPQSTNRFVWDEQTLIEMLNNTNGVVQSFVWGIGLLMVRDETTINSQSSTHFAFIDGNANVAGLVNASDGVESARYDYSPFGETLRASGAMAMANQIRFSSEWSDVLTGDTKYLHRVYRPVLGRFLNHDPLRERGGKNLYGFVRNDGVNRVDFLGLLQESDITGGDMRYSCNCGWIDSKHSVGQGKSKWEAVESALVKYEQGKGLFVSLATEQAHKWSKVQSWFRLKYDGTRTGKDRVELALDI